MIVIVVVIVIPQTLSQILNRIHRILIQVPLVMGNTRREREIHIGMGRRELDESIEREASTVEDQDTSLDGLIVASL